MNGTDDDFCFVPLSINHEGIHSAIILTIVDFILCICTNTCLFSACFYNIISLGVRLWKGRKTDLDADKESVLRKFAIGFATIVGQLSFFPCFILHSLESVHFYFINLFSFTTFPSSFNVRESASIFFQSSSKLEGDLSAPRRDVFEPSRVEPELI